MHREIQELGLGDEFKKMRRGFLELTKDGDGELDVHIDAWEEC